MCKRSELTASERREAALGLLRKDESAAVLARRHSVSEPTFYRSRDDFLAAGEAVPSDLEDGGGVLEAVR
jgi:hypothetical protein